MTTYSVLPETTRQGVEAALGDKLKRITISLDQVTVEVLAEHYHFAALTLRDHPSCRFEQMMDLCGVDYSEFPAGTPDGLRFCVVLHLVVDQPEPACATESVCAG
jgi:NADH-quinone oxidoreductase subunit C